MIFGLEMCALEAKRSFFFYFISYYVNEFGQLIITSSLEMWEYKMLEILCI